MEAQFTRQQLYELVWTEPVEKLGPSSGSPNRGLALRAARHADAARRIAAA
jgi:hypothetical protein